MFNGWLSYAGTELLNEERVRAYVRGALPTLSMPVTCQSDRSLAPILGDSEYRSPLLDDAPWIDHDDPDTYGFLGAYPLTVTGLTDSPRSATVVQNAHDGGRVLGKRLQTKDVRVTALLIAESEASLVAGKRWLAAALSGGCDPCEPGDLCFLTGTSSDNTALGDYASTVIPATSLIGNVAYWNNAAGTFKPPTTAQEVRTPILGDPLPCDEVFFHWTFSAASAGTAVVLETLGEGGVTNSMPISLPTSGGRYTISDRGTSEHTTWSRVRVTSAPNETVTITSVEMEYRTEASEDACFQKYGRQLRKVSCVTGPTTIEEFEPSVGAMERVEFTFVSEVPWVFGFEREVVSVLGHEITKAHPKSEAYVLDRLVPVCPTPTINAPIADPDCPPVPTPPRGSGITTSCADDPTSFRSYALAIPDDAIPLWAEAVPIMRLSTNSVAARKVQVRFLPRPLDIQIVADLDPCSACGSFVIDYIPPNSTFILNGMEQRAYIVQPGNRTSDAGHLLSGMTPTTLFEWPVLTCGTGYLAVVDIAAAGVTEFGVSVAVREFA